MPPCTPCRPCGRPSNVIVSPHAIETGWKPPSRHDLRPVDRDGDHGRALLQRDHRRPRLHDARDARTLARSLGEEAERVPVGDDLPHHPDRLAVGLAASDGEAAEGADQPPEPRGAMRLDLRHVVEDARARRAEDEGVEPAEVVRRDDDAAVERDALLAVDPEPGERRGGRAERRSADRPRDVDAVHRRRRRGPRSGRRPRRALSSVVSIAIASVARWVLAASRSSRRRSSSASASASTPSARHDVGWPEPRDRRRARSSAPPGDDHHPDVASLDHGVARTAELALAPAHHLADLRVAGHHGHRCVDRGLADPRRHVHAVDRDRVPSPKSTGDARASAASRAPSSNGTPSRSASHVSARYIEPVSR